MIQALFKQLVYQIFVSEIQFAEVLTAAHKSVRDVLWLYLVNYPIKMQPSQILASEINFSGSWL